VTELIRADAPRRSSMAALAIGGLVVGILWFSALSVIVAWQVLSGIADVNADGWPEDDREGALARSDTAVTRGPGSLVAMEVEFTVAKALESLPPEQREAIVLKVYYGFPFTEIAEILGCPLSTAKSRIYAGFARLKEVLAPVGRRTVNREE